ncbi:MAG: hypothetical protein NZO16_02160 [Deltaproteobacteria bacterium]|nr:hypothetical protein [Deltaproteobacteria bacterium]
MDINSFTLRLLMQYGETSRQILAPFKPLFDFGFYLCGTILLIIVLLQGLLFLKNAASALLLNVQISFREFPGISIFMFLCFLTAIFGFLRIFL